MMMMMMMTQFKDCRDREQSDADEDDSCDAGRVFLQVEVWCGLFGCFVLPPQKQSFCEEARPRYIRDYLFPTL